MRYDVKKFLFVGVLAEKEEFFKRAQEVGIIQFVDSRQKKGKSVEGEVQHIADAIKVLRGLPPTDQEVMDDYDSADDIANQINQLNEKLDSLRDEGRLLALEKERIEVFGDFSLEDVRAIEKEGKRHIQFFCAKEDVIQPTDGIIYVGTDHGLDYFVAINKERKTYERMVELHIERPLGAIVERQQQVEHEMHDAEQQLKSLARFNIYLHRGLIVKLNEQNLSETQHYVNHPLEGTGLYAVEGWAPVHKIEEMHAFLEKMHVYAEEIAIDPNDRIPTYLENEGPARVGEDLIKIYDIPAHTDTDPSLWVLSFFALFFSFIVGDAGYGLAFLATSFYLYYKFPKPTKAGKRFIKLTFILSVSCIVWGLLTGSIFGISFNIDSPVRKISIVQWLVEKHAAYDIEHKGADYQSWVKKYPKLKDITNPHEFVAQASTEKNGVVSYDLYDTYARSAMIEIALVIGMIHLTLSMLRYIKRNWGNIGWILVIFGGYLYAPTFLQGTSMFYYLTDIDVAKGGVAGLTLVGIGLFIAVGVAVFKQKLLGVFEVMTLIQVFADVLSYLRLFALGLAGSIVSATINELASGLPFVFAAILIVLAHILNMVLGIMGGVIHGLRLNFLEWYHYSFHGGGKIFQPLNLIEIEH